MEKTKEDKHQELNIIEIKNLFFRYHKKEKFILNDISLNFKKNLITAIIGPSGCGKSTLLRTLNRMNEIIKVKSELRGQVLINGNNIYGKSQNLTKLRANVGMVFQKPNPFMMSIYDNICYALRLFGIKKKKILDQIVVDSLKKVALFDEVKDKLDSFAHDLSGGQQQRLCIARAIALHPKILLMDEPCSSLDPISTLKIEALIRTLRKNFTIILVTHQMQQAARIADYTAFLYNGKLIEYNKTATLFFKPKHKLTENYLSGRF